MLVVLTVEPLAYPHFGHVPHTFISYVPAVAYVCVGNFVVTVCSAEPSPQSTVMFKPVPCTGSLMVVSPLGIVHSVIIFASSFTADFTVIVLSAVITVSICVVPALVYVLVKIYSILYVPTFAVFTSPLVVTL